MALKVDQMHYNAWWGLGNIAVKQERFPEAHQYFMNATDINKRSAMLWTYFGITKTNCDLTKQALDCFEKAE